MILGKKLYENHGLLKAYLFSFPSFISTIVQKVTKKKVSLSEHTLGVPYLILDDKGKLLCNACRLCETACPTHCLSIKGPSAAEWSMNSRPKNFQLDLSRCTLCQVCSEVCPFDAIKMSDQKIIFGASEWNWILDMEKMSKREGVNLHLQADEQPNPVQAD